MQANPSVVLTIVDNDRFHGLVRPNLRLTGTATVIPGGAPAGYTTRIRIDTIGGSGPWNE